MRYFSQLARETKARVIPARRPAWLAPVAHLLHESVAEWPVESPVIEPASKVGQIPRGHELSTGGMTRQLDSSDQSTGIDPAPRTHTFRPEEWRPEAARERVVIERHLHKELPLMPRARNSGETSGPVPIAGPPSLGRHEPAISEIDARRQRVERIAAPDQQIKPTTLQDVISEITRRQEESERRYRARETSSGPVRSTETARAEVRTERETEGVSLNIGSIIVQAAPEPPVMKASPPPGARRPSQETDHRWKRSFLDRY